MSIPQIGNSQLVSELNARLVLHAVRMMQPTFRAEVARRTRLKPATVTGIVSELLERGLLREVSGTIEPGVQGGRPPMMLQVNGAYRHILAIDLEPDCIRVAITNLLVETVEYREQMIDRFSKPGIILRQLSELCRQVIEAADVDLSQLQGAAMSLPGLIDREHAVIISCTNMPEWQNVKVGDWIERDVGIRPQVDRSVHLAALYEGWINPDIQEGATLVLSLRTGIGMSLLHQGQLYTGHQGFDGEIGHTVVEINGQKCECGSQGCLETFVSASAVIERVKSMTKQGRCRGVHDAIEDHHETLRPELVYRLAKEGDADCAEIVRDIGRYIGIAAANMVNVIAPDRLVICGAIDTADELILDAVRAQINTQALPKLREHLVVCLATAKEKNSLLGAGVSVVRELFDLPKLQHIRTGSSVFVRKLSVAEKM